LRRTSELCFCRCVTLHGSGPLTRCRGKQEIRHHVRLRAAWWRWMMASRYRRPPPPCEERCDHRCDRVRCGGCIIHRNTSSCCSCTHTHTHTCAQRQTSFLLLKVSLFTVSNSPFLFLFSPSESNPYTLHTHILNDNMRSGTPVPTNCSLVVRLEQWRVMSPHCSTPVFFPFFFSFRSHTFKR
jgi:hypothetical protein